MLNQQGEKEGRSFVPQIKPKETIILPSPLILRTRSEVECKDVLISKERKEPKPFVHNKTESSRKLEKKSILNYLIRKNLLSKI